MKKWSKEELSGQALFDAMQALKEWRKNPFNQELYNKAHCAQPVDSKSYYGTRHPEYITMSRKPGIGSAWYDKFSSDIYPSGFAVLPGGKKVKLPKFYDSRFELDNFIAYDKMKGLRLVRAQEDPNNSKRRLQDREAVKLSKSNSLIRGYENG